MHTNNRSFRRAALGMAVVLLLIAGPARATPSAAPVQIGGLLPSWAKPATRLDRVADSAWVHVELILPWRDPAGVRALVREVSDPTSPRYAHYLTSQEFRARFAPSLATVDAAVSWLQASGLEVGRLPLNRVVVPARGRAATVERAFGVTLSRYRVGSRAVRAPDGAPWLPAPLARAGITVRGLSETDAFLQTSEPESSDPPPAIPETPANPADAAPSGAVQYARPCSAHDGATVDKVAPPVYGKRQPAVTCATSVAALRASYGVDAMLKRRIDGSGQTIVMIGSHAMRRLPSDLAEWSRRYGLPGLREGQFDQFSYPGAYETPADPVQTVLRPQVWAQQSAMLFETMRAIAPGANYLYVGSTSSLDLQNATLLAVDRHFGDVVVNGWYAASESLVLPSDTAPIDRIAEQAAATGISLLWASGDLGDNAKFNATQTGETPVVVDEETTGQHVEGPTIPNIPVIPPHPSVSFPAHNPMVTAVGATSLLLGPKGRYLREIGWAKSTRPLAGRKWQPPDNGSYRASGGGTSMIYNQPGYQTGVVPDEIAWREGGGLGRAVPDIAVNGDAEAGMSIGYTMAFPDGTIRYAERRVNADTASTALFGALIALANHRAARPHGFVNPLLYRMAQTSGTSFRDIVLMGGARKAGVRVDYINASDPSKGTRRLLKTFEEFGTNKPRPGYDTCTGLGTPSLSFLQRF